LATTISFLNGNGRGEMPLSETVMNIGIKRDDGVLLMADRVQRE